MEIKYLGREVEITSKYLSVMFPKGSVYVGTVMPHKGFKMKKIPKIIKLLIMPHSYLERTF